jgi:hypothetical protein
VEFEARAPSDAANGIVRFPTYAVYNVCTGPTGQCLYRRQDVDLRIELKPLSP